METTKSLGLLGLGGKLTIKNDFLSFKHPYAKNFRVHMPDIETVSVDTKSFGNGMLKIIGKGSVLASSKMPLKWAEASQEWILGHMKANHGKKASTHVHETVVYKEVNEKKKGSCSKGCAVILGVFILFAIIGAFTNPDTHTQTSNTTATKSVPKQGSSSVSIGEQGKVHVNGSDTILIAVDKDAFDQYMDAAIANDSIGVVDLMSRGKIFPVKNDTKIQVIDASFTTRKVRVMEGEMFGQAGWVPYEFVVK